MRPVGRVEDKIGVETLPGHRIVTGTGSVVDGKDDLRDFGGRHRLDKAGTGPDDAAMLGIGTDHKARRRPEQRARASNAGRSFR